MPTIKSKIPTSTLAPSQCPPSLSQYSTRSVNAHCVSAAPYHHATEEERKSGWAGGGTSERGRKKGSQE
eukprot:1813065-Rhodomonas_salina.1